jgi:hypothetical protein
MAAMRQLQTALIIAKGFCMDAVAYRKEEIDGINIFYREAGRKEAPTILLLHGFPTAGHMFRDLIPQLADRYGPLRAGDSCEGDRAVIRDFLAHRMFRWTVRSSPPGGSIRLSVDLLEPPLTLKSASGPLNLFP